MYQYLKGFLFLKFMAVAERNVNQLQELDALKE